MLLILKSKIMQSLLWDVLLFTQEKQIGSLFKRNQKGLLFWYHKIGEWEELIEKCFPNGKKVTRYAIKKITRFDKKTLERNIEQLPKGYELAKKLIRIYMINV